MLSNIYEPIFGDDFRPAYRVLEDGSVIFTDPKEAAREEASRQDALLKSDAARKRVEERDARVGTPNTSWVELRAFHWQGVPELPIVVVPSKKPTLDITNAHTDRVQRENVLGNFCDIPIVTLDALGMEADQENEVYRLCQEDSLYQDSYLTPEDKGYGVFLHSTHDSFPAEILPGEVRCEDGIIRRTTAAETIGYDSYHNQAVVESGQQRVSIADGVKAAQDGAMVYFRPNGKVGEGEYALVEVAA